MINMKIRKAAGKPTYFCGIERADLEALAKDGILTFDIGTASVAIMIVKTLRDEFMANVRKMTGMPENPQVIRTTDD